jgi:hypothetical protein
MTIYDLVLTHKFDTMTTDKLWNFTYEEIKPIVPDLLMWLQDLHWPVSEPVSKYLQSISEHLTDNILDILKGHDEEWKYAVITVFGLRTNKPLAPRLLEEIKRIASDPTPGEQTENVHEIAAQVASRYIL